MTKLGKVTPDARDAFDLIPGLMVRFTMTVELPAETADTDLAELLRELADEFEAGELIMTQHDECAFLENPEGEKAGCYVCHPEIKQ